MSGEGDDGPIYTVRYAGDPPRPFVDEYDPATKRHRAVDIVCRSENSAHRLAAELRRAAHLAAMAREARAAYWQL